MPDVQPRAWTPLLGLKWLAMVEGLFAKAGATLVAELLDGTPAHVNCVAGVNAWRAG